MITFSSVNLHTQKNINHKASWTHIRCDAVKFITFLILRSQTFDTEEGTERISIVMIKFAAKASRALSNGKSASFLLPKQPPISPPVTAALPPTRQFSSKNSFLAVNPVAVEMINYATALARDQKTGLCYKLILHLILISWFEKKVLRLKKILSKWDLQRTHMLGDYWFWNSVILLRMMITRRVWLSLLVLLYCLKGSTFS